MTPSLTDTLSLIKQLHDGQVDAGGKPYYLHPVSVMTRLPADATEAMKHVALLHDVIEDTAMTSYGLLSLGYSEEIVAAVRRLSRPVGKTYMDWIRELAASKDVVAITVKIADNEDNSDPARIAQLPPEKQDIVNRYRRSLSILRPALVGIKNGNG